MFSLFRLVLVVAVVSVAAREAQPTSGVQRAASRPNVLLITLDTVRADRMGFLGSTRGLTPALDALARHGMVFTRAYAQAPVTTVSHATILTGTFPPFHRVTDFGAALPASVPYLPDLFRRAGYRTGAFVGSLVLDPRSGTAPGFERGFDRYDAGFRVRRAGEDRYQTLERRGDEVVARAQRWIAETGSAPWFAWVHLYDAHDPYDPPADLKRRFTNALYDGEIAAVDRAVGRLLQAAGDRAIVVVTADHGEALGEHGEETHGVFLYDEVVRVPLIVRLPDGRGAGARVDARVRLADVAPTILEAAALARATDMQGESLLALAPGAAPPSQPAQGNQRAQPPQPRPPAQPSQGTQPPQPAQPAPTASADRPAYAETDYPRHAFGWSMLASWRNDRFLLVRAPKPELYDLAADPGATRNLAASRARVVEGMTKELEQFVRRSAGAGGSERTPTTIDPALAERLAALGYVSGSGATAAVPGTDPKDKIAIANALHTAVVAVEEGRFASAIPLLERVIASEPGIPIAHLHLGVAHARQRQFAQAIPPLTKAVSLQPNVMSAHYELALALYETGDLPRAARELEIVAKQLPGWADARYSLGSVYARIDRAGEAQTELRAALALEPRHFRANLLLGRILTLQNQAAAAVPLLRTATEANPSSSEAFDFLADAYEKTGNSTEAATARLRARALSKR